MSYLLDFCKNTLLVESIKLSVDVTASSSDRRMVLGNQFRPVLFRSHFRAPVVFPRVWDHLSQVFPISPSVVCLLFCHISHYGIGNQRFIKINHLCLKVPNYLSHWAINDQHVPNDLAETQIQISKTHFIL